MKKKIFIGSVVVAALALTFVQVGHTKTTSLAKEVEKDYVGMEELIDKAVRENSELAFSSNPYDYIKDNPYYDKLIEKGVSVLPILEEKMENEESGSGLLGYITAIAMEEITDCSLSEIQDADWASPEEFTECFKEFKEELPSKIDSIMDSKMADVEKVEELDKLGVFAVPVLEEQEFDDKEAKEKSEEVLASYDLNAAEVGVV